MVMGVCEEEACLVARHPSAASPHRPQRGPMAAHAPSLASQPPLYMVAPLRRHLSETLSQPSRLSRACVGSGHLHTAALGGSGLSSVAQPCAVAGCKAGALSIVPASARAMNGGTRIPPSSRRRGRHPFVPSQGLSQSPGYHGGETRGASTATSWLHHGVSGGAPLGLGCLTP